MEAVFNIIVLNIQPLLVQLVNLHINNKILIFHQIQTF